METNRRSFLRGLLLAAVAPSVLLPKFKDAHKWKRTENLWIANPEYVTAEYETAFMFDARAYMGTWRFVSVEFPEWNNIQKPVDTLQSQE